MAPDRNGEGEPSIPEQVGCVNGTSSGEYSTEVVRMNIMISEPDYILTGKELAMATPMQQDICLHQQTIHRI